MNATEAVQRIEEINRLIVSLEKERDQINEDIHLPIVIVRDWADDEYPYMVRDVEAGKILTKFSCKHAAYRDLVRESVKRI